MAGSPTPSQWKPGQSGNAAGRPKGSRHRSTELLESLLLEDGRAVVAAIVQRALTGDVAAAKLIIDRLIPAPRDRRVVIDLPPCIDAAGVSAAQAVVVEAVASGEIRPSEGEAVAGLLELRRRSIETSDLEVRVQQLEGGRR